MRKTSRGGSLLEQLVISFADLPLWTAILGAAVVYLLFAWVVPLFAPHDTNGVLKSTAGLVRYARRAVREVVELDIPCSDER